MATKSKLKAKTTTVKARAPRVSTRVTSVTIRENAKKDLSPNWTDAINMSGEEFTAYFHFAMNYYNQNFTGKLLKPRVIDWMTRNGYSKTVIAAFKATEDWRTNLTAGAIASCLLRGMPECHPEFNSGRSTSEWLRKEIETILLNGVNDSVTATDTKTAKPLGPVLTIQDRVREQAGAMSEELDLALDSWVTDPEGFDPKAFKVSSLLRGKGTKAAHARFVKAFYQRGHNELMELVSAKADAQLKEAYGHNSRKNIKKLMEFYQAIMEACDQISQEAKVLRKVRAPRAVSKEKIVSKMKFLKEDKGLKLISVNPADIVGAAELWCFNVKTRKLCKYVADSLTGPLGVKGTTITGYDEAKSISKTLRKPAEQLKEFAKAGKVALRGFLTAIKATETKLNGRINKDMILLKIA